MKIIKNKKFILSYSIIFFLCCLISFYSYYSNGKSFIYDGDGWEQYLKLLIYYSRYLRKLFENLFVNHKFIIPQWDFRIGEGADIITSFNCYVLGDPISFFCVFVPEKYMYIFYDFGVILRLFLSGIVFSEFCLYKKKDANVYALLSGAIVYTFCFWNVFGVSRHFHFINPMILLPLLLLGIEKIFNNENPYYLTIIVFISAITSVYYFVILVAVVVVYTLIKVIFIYKANIKKILLLLIKITKYSLLGVLLAGVIVVPMLFALTDDFRLAVDTTIRLYYPLSFYAKLPSMFFSVTRVYWLCMGFAAPTIFSIFILLKRRNEEKLLLIINIVTLFFIICPIFAQATNGFKYVTNKWSFAIALLIGYDFVSQWNYLKSNYKWISILTLLIFVPCVIIGSNINLLIPVSISILCVIILILYSKGLISYKIFQTLLLLMVCVNVCFNSVWYFSPLGVNYTIHATNITDDSNIANSSEAMIMEQYCNTLNDDSFYRYSGSNLTINSSILFDVYSTDFYWSISNKYVSRYRDDLGMEEYSLCNYKEYDKRDLLYSLANVKYYISEEEYNGLIPFGFNVKENYCGYTIYENENYLPFGYTYDDAISYDEWKNLNIIHREESLTKAVVIDNLAESDSINLLTQKIQYNSELNGGIYFKDKKVIVNDINSSIYLIFDNNPNYQTYLSFEGLSYTDGKEWINNPNTTAYINIETSNGIKKSIKYATLDDKYQHNRNDFVSYLGTGDNIKWIKLTFDSAGEYSFNEISILAKPTKYKEDINKLSENHLTNIRISDNEVVGNIECKNKKYLVLSIPYSKGWKAYVDGEKVQTFIANGCYTGIALNAGNHEVQLKYSTPYLNYGLIISMFGLALFIGDYLFYRKKKRING